MTDKKDIVIEILGQAYTIKTSGDEKYIKKLASYVDNRIQDLKESGLDSKTQHLKIAILTCMNIADELFQEKENNKEDKESSRKELDELKSVGRVSSFKNKLQDIEKDIEENETDGPIDAINKIVESIDVEDKKKVTIVEEDKIIDIGNEADDEEDDIEKNVCDKCDKCDKCDEEKDIEEDEESKEFLDGIDDNKDTKDNEDEI